MKRYGHATALDGCDFEVLPGEILAVIGDNGAGKSSLIKALSGATVPDEGKILLDGAPVKFRSPLDAREKGIGGGLVIDGRLHGGPHGNAGAVGSMPLALANGGAPRQLLQTASGFVLEQRFVAAGVPAAAAHDHRALDAGVWAITERWLDEACPAIAMTIAGATALLDLEAIVIDGEIDRLLVRELIRRTQAALDRIEWEGMVRPQLIEGTIGADARAMGGAILPLYAHFAPTHELFLKH